MKQRRLDPVQSVFRPVLLWGAAALISVGCAPPIEAPLQIGAPQVDAERIGQPLRTSGSMVVSANEIASRAGARILEAGGNAVDAAIATGFALAVVHPTAGNVGGGGFLVLRFPDGEATTIDFREKAPLDAHPEMFVDSAGNYSRAIQANSHLAVGVPGTVAGFWLAHERYGRLPWRTLLEPAITLARDGVLLSEPLARSLAAQIEGPMQPYPASIAAFSNQGTAFRAGELWQQPELALTLERIRDQGRDGFYRGETARLIAEEMERGGGIITEADLAAYQAVERVPIRGTFRGVEIISMPPPSSGGIALVQMLNILEHFDLRSLGHGSAAYLHHLAEAQRLAYRDRARHLADTDFVEVPITQLTNKEYAARLAAKIDPDRAGRSAPEELALPWESEETTHYSVVDAEGIAASVTYTLEAGYGSKITVPGAGFLLNNEMGDFNGFPGLTSESGQIGTEPNLARPEQRMLSSMTPTILAREGELLAVLGSPGGRTIINTVLHLVLNLTEFEMSLEAATAAGRSHHQWLPDQLMLEETHLEPAVAAALQSRGHRIATSTTQGQAHSILVDAVTGERIGVPDPRGSEAGAAGG